jgi:selenocysteine lyase/cysteine desulfurase
MDIADLKKLLTPKTRLVSMTHASNILGTINPIKEIAKIVHQNNSYLCVDAVAYAPHRLPDVQEMDIDFYVFSFYKVYGPHYSALYGKREILEKLPNINHFFIQEDDIPYKLQPGSANYELSYAYVGYRDYLEKLIKKHFPELKEPFTRSAYEKIYQLFAKHEEILTRQLLEFLNKKNKVKIIGETEAGGEKRVATVSFVIDGVVSSDITKKVDDYKIGIRHGDFYARRLIDALNYSKTDGVIRVSMVHYNTLDEVDRLIEVLDRLF